VRLSRVLVDEMPCTRRALRAGHITEWRATILVRETACLSLEDRQEVDRRLAGNAVRLESMGDRRLEGAARSMAAELDAAACVLRRRVAESQRRVTLGPVPDTMTRLSAELPVATGVAVWKSLSDAADSARSAGDPRSRGQVMVDTLVDRVLGTTGGGVVPVEIELVVSDEVLFGDRDEAAYLEGFARSPPSSPARWPRPQGRAVWPGCAVSTGDRAPVSWWRRTRGAGASPVASRGSSAFVTRPVALPGATRRSGTPTISSPWPATARRPVTTVRACARPATTPSKHWDGRSGSAASTCLSTTFRQRHRAAHDRDPYAGGSGVPIGGATTSWPCAARRGPAHRPRLLHPGRLSAACAQPPLDTWDTLTSRRD
jgi:hypothetical protein